jgi:hypothetical protein
VQKIWGKYLQIQGGDLLPLLAKLAATNIYAPAPHHAPPTSQHLGDWCA